MDYFFLSKPFSNPLIDLLKQCFCSRALSSGLQSGLQSQRWWYNTSDGVSSLADAPGGADSGLCG